MKTLRCELYCAPFHVFALPVGKTANIPATVFDASVLLLSQATAYRSEVFTGSLSHVSPTTASQTSL